MMMMTQPLVLYSFFKVYVALLNSNFEHLKFHLAGGSLYLYYIAYTMAQESLGYGI